MNRRVQPRATGLTGERSSSLMWLLLLAALVPSLSLLWFMNRAVENERVATRLQLAEAYRGYLSLARERLESEWQQYATALDVGLDTIPPRALFAAHVLDGLADAVVILGDEGTVVYPGLTPTGPEIVRGVDWAKAAQLESTDPIRAAELYAKLAGEAANASGAAQALQARLRCLVRAGQLAEAIALVTGPLSDARFSAAADVQGRLVVPNAQLMVLELIDDSESRVAVALREQLEQTLADYERTPMPASQRRLLMHALQRLYPDRTAPSTRAGEDLAAAVVEADRMFKMESGIRPSSLADTWLVGSTSGRVIAIFTTQTLLDRIRTVLQASPLPSGVHLELERPDHPGDGDSSLKLPAGEALPGWNLVLSIDNPDSLEAAATRERIAGYVWAGTLALAIAVVLVVLGLGMVRRQTALSQLKNDLVANVTHELKTPLASMRLLVDTLLDSPKLNEKTAREYLGLIAQENLRLSRLIENFLTFSRIERRRYQFDFQPVPAGKIAEDAAATVRERFNTKGCTFDTEIAPDLPDVVADADAMVTALVNLLDNAWKYSGDQKQITLAVAAADGRIVFKVTDNGIGLSPRDVQRVFNRFHRVEQRGSRTGGGCGLGLSIVKFVVTAHGGSVDVKSEPGCGSAFTLSLPLKAHGKQEGGRS